MNNLQNGYLQFAFNEFLADCQIKLLDQLIPAHKIVLASNSGYFYEYFKSNSEGLVLLPEIKSSSFQSKPVSEIFKHFLKYLYGGLDENLIVEYLDVDSAFTFLTVSIALKVPTLQEVAEKFIVIEILGIENVVKVLKEGILIDSRVLVSASSNLITEYFEAISCDPELKQQLSSLPCEIICSILSSDDVNVNSELSVYNFMIHYLEVQNSKSPGLKQEETISLLSKIRWSHLSHSDLLSAASIPLLSLAKDLILEGLSAQLSRHESASFSYKIETIPRKSLMKFGTSESAASIPPRDSDNKFKIAKSRSGKTLTEILERENSSQDSVFQDEFKYQFDFDQNGLFYYLGTQRNSGKWRNPHLTGQVRVFASSLTFGKLEDFVGRTENSLRTGKDQPAFIGVDLGPGFLFQLEAYTLKNSANTSYAFLNWKVEASVDRSRWKVVDKRIHWTGFPDTDKKTQREREVLTKRAGSSTWAVNPAGGFRFFRIVCLGVNVSGTSNIGISCAEFYGKIVDGRIGNY